MYNFFQLFMAWLVQVILARRCMFGMRHLSQKVEYFLNFSNVSCLILELILIRWKFQDKLVCAYKYKYAGQARLVVITTKMICGSLYSTRYIMFMAASISCIHKEDTESSLDVSQLGKYNLKLCFAQKLRYIFQPYLSVTICWKMQISLT